MDMSNSNCTRASSSLQVHPSSYVAWELDWNLNILLPKCTGNSIRSLEWQVLSCRLLVYGLVSLTNVLNCPQVSTRKECGRSCHLSPSLFLGLCDRPADTASWPESAIHEMMEGVNLANIHRLPVPDWIYSSHTSILELDPTSALILTMIVRFGATISTSVTYRYAEAGGEDGTVQMEPPPDRAQASRTQLRSNEIPT